MNPPTPEDYARFEVLKDLVDEMIDLMLNYRQSGHPGGSRSKVHLLIAALLSGAMRWDLLRPWRTFQDRLVLSAGHAVPVIYALLAVLNEVMRERYHLTGDATFAFPDGGAHALTWEDLLRLRRRSGGFGDLVVARLQHSAILEAKVGKSEPNELQRDFRNNWQGAYFVVRSPEDAERQLNLWLLTLVRWRK